MARYRFFIIFIYIWCSVGFCGLPSTISFGKVLVIVGSHISSAPFSLLLFLLQVDYILDILSCPFRSFFFLLFSFESCIGISSSSLFLSLAVSRVLMSPSKCSLFLLRCCCGCFLFCFVFGCQHFLLILPWNVYLPVYITCLCMLSTFPLEL